MKTKIAAVACGSFAMTTFLKGPSHSTSLRAGSCAQGDVFVLGIELSVLRTEGSLGQKKQRVQTSCTPYTRKLEIKM